MNDRPDRDPAPAVTRAVRILGLLADADGDPLTLSEIARALGIAKSSTANLCLALEESRMVQRLPQGYQLGRRTAEIGGAFALQFNQVREFFGVCRASTVLRHEVVQVAMLDGADTLYLVRHEGRTPYRLGTPLGSRLPAALTASGNALLALREDAAIEELIGAGVPYPRLAAGSPTDLAAVMERIRAARGQGYAVDVNGSTEGVTGVAVALEPWAPSDPPLAMGVALPTELTEDDLVARIGHALLEAREELTNPLTRAERTIRGEFPAARD